MPEIPEASIGRVLETLGRSQKPLVVTGLTFTRCKARETLLNFIERHQVPLFQPYMPSGFYLTAIQTGWG